MHNGHLDLMRRAGRIYDKLTVAVLNNPLKSSAMFGADERVDIIRSALGNRSNIVVDSFQGLLAEYTKTIGATVIVKGLRAISDFEYELQMAHLNRQLNPAVETTFIMTATRWSYLSSTRVKELAQYDADISKLVPKATLEAIEVKLGR